MVQRLVCSKISPTPLPEHRVRTLVYTQNIAMRRDKKASISAFMLHILW
jgi:hypothetical protein